MEMDPTEKLVLKTRADVETQLIEVNVQSAGVPEEEQVFFTEEDNETENKFGEEKGNQKQDSRSRRPSSKSMPYLKISLKEPLISPRNFAEQIKYCYNYPKTRPCFT